MTEPMASEPAEPTTRPQDDRVGTVRRLGNSWFVKLVEPRSEPWHVVCSRGQQNVSGWQSDEDMEDCPVVGYVPVTECVPSLLADPAQTTELERLKADGAKLLAVTEEFQQQRDLLLWLHAEQRWLRDMEKLQRAVNDMHSRIAVAGQVDDAIARVGALDPIFEDLARLVAAYKSAYDREPHFDVAGHMMIALLRERGWERRPAVLLRADDCDCAPPWADCMHGPEPVDALDFMRWLHAEAVFFGHGWHDQWMSTRETVRRLTAERDALQTQQILDAEFLEQPSPLSGEALRAVEEAGDAAGDLP